MKVTSLSDDKVLALYEKAIKAHIRFMAAASEVQKHLRKISPYELELRSGYESRLEALETIIVERGLTVPEEWSKYPTFPDYWMMRIVLEHEKANRLMRIRDKDEFGYERRKAELGVEIEALTDRVLLMALDEANIMEGKMLKAENIAQSILEMHGYLEKISIIMPYINRYWEAAMVVKDRGYVTANRPALDVNIKVDDVIFALEEALDVELAKVSDEKEKEVIRKIFIEAMADRAEILCLVNISNSKVNKKGSK